MHHKLFGYRGVVVDVNARFELSDEWYDAVARSRPPKDKPWYQVLVDRSDRVTYVAERNLEETDDLRPIRHPDLDTHFDTFDDGRYSSRRPLN